MRGLERGVFSDSAELILAAFHFPGAYITQNASQPLSDMYRSPARDL